MAKKKVEVKNGNVFIYGKRIHNVSVGSRKCYEYRDIIVKLDTDGFGTIGYQCNREVSLYKKFSRADRKYFHPLIAHGDGWVAQKIIKNRARGRVPNWAWDKATELGKKYNIADLAFCVKNRIYNNFFMTKDGRLLIYDWGW